MSMDDVARRLDPVQAAFFLKVIRHLDQSTKLAHDMCAAMPADAMVETTTIIAASLSLAMTAGHMMAGRHHLDQQSFERMMRAAFDVMMLIDADVAAEGAKSTMSEVDAIFGKREKSDG